MRRSRTAPASAHRARRDAPPRAAAPLRRAWRAQIGRAGRRRAVAAGAARAGHAQRRPTPAFSTSGTRARSCTTRPASLGAWFSDLAFFAVRLLGLVGAGHRPARLARRAWRACCARSATQPAAPTAARGAGCSGSAWRCCWRPAASLEWTRLYQWEPRLPAATPAACSATCWARPASSCSASPARACCGSPRWWPGCRWRSASRGCALAERDRRAGLDSLREQRVERIERAEDERLGEQALREREQVVEVEHQLHEEHVPIVDRAAGDRGAQVSSACVKERQKPLFTELADTKLPQVDLLDAAPGPQRERVAPRRWR